MSTTAIIVDDEMHIRKFLALTCKVLGVEVLAQAANGAEGVLLYKQAKPDFVLMDINMPGVDGISALRQIMEHDAEAQVIMLTSLATRISVESCLEAGALFYIRKDTPSAELKQSLARLFGTSP